MLTQPVLVVLFARGGADQPVATVTEVGQRHLGDDAALVVQEIVERGAAGLRHDAGDHVIEPGGGACARDLELGEARQVEHGHAFLNGLALTLDCLVPRRTTERGFRLGRIACLREVDRAFPTSASAELRALRSEAQVGR